MKPDLLEWIEQSASAFDVLVCKKTELPKDFQILDAEALDREWHRTFSSRVGAFPIHKALSGLQNISHRVTHRIARSNAQDIDVSINGLRNAWFYPIYSEFATLLPIRHMARKLAAQNTGQVFAIPLASRAFLALNAWYHNDLEPLYLAYELRRQKVSVVLFTEDEGASELEFKLSKRWLPKGYPQIRRDENFTTVMCKRAMSKAAYVSKMNGATRQHKPGFFTFQRHFGIDRDTASLTVNLVAGPSFDGISAYSSKPDLPSLIQGFESLIIPLTCKVTQWYRDEFKNHPIRNAHISDHASLEGGLMAAEVIRKGGQSYVWPHSSNLVHKQVHDPKDVAQVTVGAQSTGVHWAKKFGEGKVSIDVNTILPKTTKAPLFDKDSRLNVVLFAGAHVLKRLPLLDNEAHKATWAKVLRDLHNSDIELTIKHKSSWETRDWIRSLAPEGAKLQFSRTHANKLNLPNMVFLSISLTSTAILEGIERGVPGMTVRDVFVDETPYYDPAFIPCLPSKQAADFIAGLNSMATYNKLRERQKVWFDRETSSSDVPGEYL